MQSLKRFFNPSMVDLAIDLGTQNLLISDKLQVIYNEATLVAQTDSTRKGDQFVFGSKAMEVERSSAPGYSVHRLLENGVIVDMDRTSEFLERVFRPIVKRPRVLITHPLDISDIERRAFRMVAENAGAAKVVLIPEPVAFVAGICSKFRDRESLLMIDVGAGISEAVLFSRGRVVSFASNRVGGHELEKALISYARRVRKYEISQSASIAILNKIAYERNDAFLKRIPLLGKKLETGLPEAIFFEVKEVEKVLEPLFLKIVETALQVLDDYPPDMSEKIIEEGVFFTGGASQFPRIKELLAERTTVSVVDDSQPLLGVARGEIQVLHDKGLLEFLANEYD